MNNNTNYITSSQLTLTLKSIVIGIDVMFLPNVLIPFSKQSAWLSCLIGSIYPIYLIILAHFMCKKYPNYNILTLSKICFGNFLGTILNFIFLSFFTFMCVNELSGYSNTFRIYSVPFLKNYQIILSCMLPIAYVAYKGIKSVARTNEVIFFLTIILAMLPIAIIPYGSILNLMPVLGTNFTNILAGARQTILFYSGIEIIFLFYPFMQNKDNLLKCGFIATIIITSFYVLSIIASIYYLSCGTSLKFLSPILALTDSVRIPFINSFRYFFISFWSLVEFKCIATYYFVISYILNKSIKKISRENFVLILYPIIIFIALFVNNLTIRKYYINKMSPVFIIFNLIYISVICFLIYIKKGDAYESS